MLTLTILMSGAAGLAVQKPNQDKPNVLMISVDDCNVEWTMDAALKFLDAQKGSEKPFMLMMCTTYPHGPAPHMKDKNGKYVYSLDADPTITGEGVRTDLKKELPTRADIMQQYKALKASNPSLDVTAVTALWWDSIVGRVMDKLREMGVEDNTLVIYMSDHGVEEGGKTTMYEGGVSIKSVFNDQETAVRDALMMELGYARAVKTDDFKNDPAEKTNLFGTDVERDKRLKALMKRELNKYSARRFGEFVN